MNLAIFENFDKECSKNLPNAIEEILKAKKRKKVRAIGFITVDDFYGFYLSYDYKKNNLDEFYDWKNGIEPTFLYQPLVDVVDACTEIDLCKKSDEKWNFAEALLTVLEKNIKQIPNEIFEENNYKKEDILFLQQWLMVTTWRKCLMHL